MRDFSLLDKWVEDEEYIPRLHPHFDIILFKEYYFDPFDIIY